MQIKELHAHFLISLGSYNNERIGFTVVLSDDDSPEEIVASLRKKAREIVGPTADDFYDRQREASAKCYELERKLSSLRKEWNATAEFLKAQGLKADAPSMPQFSNLLSAAIDKDIESEFVSEAEFSGDF